MEGMWAIVYVFAVAAGFGALVGAISGGLVGWLRGQQGAGVPWGIVGGGFGGVIGVAMGMGLVNVVFVGEFGTLFVIFLLFFSAAVSSGQSGVRWFS